MRINKDKIIGGLFLINGLIVVAALAGILVLLFTNALPAFKEISWTEFLFTTVWNPTSYVQERYGILSMVVSTMLVTIGALVIAIPLGIGTAAYLSDVASRRVREIAKPVVEILAGIPSVVIGFLGIVLTGPLIARLTGAYNGLNAINGAVLLAVMSLPTIVSLSEDASGRGPEIVCRGLLGPGGQPLADPDAGQAAGGQLRDPGRLYAGHGPGHRGDYDGADGHGQRPGHAARPDRPGADPDRHHRH